MDGLEQFLEESLDGSPANITDALFAIADAIKQLSRSVDELATAPLMGETNIGGDIYAGLEEIAGAIDDLFPVEVDLEIED
jgi:hypothetical protein